MPRGRRQPSYDSSIGNEHLPGNFALALHDLSLVKPLQGTTFAAIMATESRPLPVLSVELPDAVYLIQFCNALSRLAVRGKGMVTGKVSSCYGFAGALGMVEGRGQGDHNARRKIPNEKRERLCHARSYHKFRFQKMLQRANKLPGKKPKTGGGSPYTNGGDSPSQGPFGGPRPAPAGGQGGPGGEEYVSKFNYDAAKDDELSLVKGMKIQVLQMEGDGWWLGQNADAPGQQGWFPSNYVVQASSAVPPPAASDVITVVRTLYAFNSGNAEELAFVQDEMLDVIEEPANDPDWWLARNADGETGLVPKNYVEVVRRDYDPVIPNTPNQTEPARSLPSPASIPTQSNGLGEWFFGSISRVEAERLLEHRSQTGEFLVRNSETATGYSISMKMPGRIRHFKVTALPSGEFGIGQRKFDSLDALIAHYKRAPIYTSPEQGKAYLTTPLPH